LKKYLLLLLTINTLFAEELRDEKAFDLKPYELKVSNEEGKIISEIVSTLGCLSLISLGFKKSHLKELGSNLKGIGPLHFLGYVFTNNDLKAHMKTIHQSSMKWKGFLDGLKPGFEREFKSNQLMQDLPGFADLIKMDVNKLVHEAKKEDWNRFVEVMLEASEVK
jgi:hypothetical protein